MSKPVIVVAAVALLALGGGIAAWVLWPEPEPEPEEVAEDKDTGFTRDETEELMRTIGYVQ